VTGFDCARSVNVLDARTCRQPGAHSIDIEHDDPLGLFIAWEEFFDPSGLLWRGSMRRTRPQAGDEGRQEAIPSLETSADQPVAIARPRADHSRRKKTRHAARL
jgi:hypothetical protein